MRFGPCLVVYLVIVVMAMEKGLLPENHARQHTTKAPHIQTVVIHLKHTVKNLKGTEIWFQDDKVAKMFFFPCCARWTLLGFYTCAPAYKPDPV